MDKKVKKNGKSKNGSNFTRKMKRELKNSVNMFERVGVIINHAFPNIYSYMNNNIEDTRHPSYTDYEMKSILMTPIMAFACGIKSMNNMTETFNSDETIKNFNQLLNTDYEDIPHKDTIMNVLQKLNPSYLEKLRVDMIRKLIRSKALDQFKHFGLWHIVIDGTELYSSLDNLGPGAISKTYNKGQDDEYTIYSYYALEAKLVCGNNVFSICTEFVENETYTDESGNTYRKFDKQDCETKAAYRILEKLHKYFPKLGIIIGGDALYVNQNFLDLCEKYHFEYIIRYKEDGACSIQRNFDEIKITEDNCSYANEVIFGELKKKDFKTVNMVTYKEKDEETKTITEFKYITSLEVNSRNKEEIVKIGRFRWKIENKGFNEQKHGVTNIEHIYTKDCIGTKNIYLLIQISEIILTLLNCADCLVKALKVTKKEVSRLLMTDLTSKITNLNFNEKIQLRLIPL